MSAKLTMVVTNGMFIIGEQVKSNKLLLPRQFQIIKNGAEIQMAPLPLTPPFLILTTGYLHYPVGEENKNVFDLYERVTNPELIKKAQEENRQSMGPRVITGMN